MRLLNTTDLSFAEFVDSQDVEYAILSHRWYSTELTYGEMSLCPIPEAKSASFEKVVKFCELARSLGYPWAWVDTVCIDKSSSAELQESINSMWTWYENAQRCFVYLGDVSTVSASNMVPPAPGPDRRLSKTASSVFCHSVWFQRGWTLQELLAPADVMFYNSQWQEIGTKSTLSTDIFTATAIPESYLRHRERIQHTSVALRMSWASKRETTRTEDRAYSLMGLFNVNMPLLYGEGNKAFLRLQLEILQQQDDESIFAWSLNGHGVLGMGMFEWGLLAPLPDCFSDSGQVRCFPLQEERMPFRMTNKGLEVRLPLAQSEPGVFFLGQFSSTELPRFCHTGDRIDVELNCGLETRLQSDGVPTLQRPEVNLAFQHPEVKRDNIYLQLTYTTAGWQRMDINAALKFSSARRRPFASFGSAAAMPAIYIKQPGMHIPWRSLVSDRDRD